MAKIDSIHLNSGVDGSKKCIAYGKHAAFPGWRTSRFFVLFFFYRVSAQLESAC